eukprot:jgi/Hompol1/1434/HPOL_003769-RA
MAATAATTEEVAASAKNRILFSGTWDGMVKIARTEGPTALWRGLSPTLFMSIPSTVVYYTGYDILRERFGILMNERHGFYAPLLAGAIARTISATIISPIELIRTRMQAGDKGLMDIFRGVISMTRHSGPSSLFRGLIPTLWRDVPFSALYWVGYEAVKTRVARRDRDGRITNEFTASFVAGSVSGMMAAIVTHPFDVAKTFQQVAQASQPIAPSFFGQPVRSHTQPGMLSVFQGIIQQSGVRGLFVGLAPRVAKATKSASSSSLTASDGRTLPDLYSISISPPPPPHIPLPKNLVPVALHPEIEVCSTAAAPKHIIAAS